MLSKLRERMESEKGFTLVELLVVILIIGILAAIAIPSFLSQREKAQDAEAKTAARSAQTANESRFTDEGTYAASAAALRAIEPTLNDATNLTVAGPDTDADGVAEGVATGTAYSVSVESDAGHDFLVSRLADGTVSRTCPDAGKGGCPSDKTW